jgi:putative tricarboxylic transport membrane protein
MDLSLYTAGLNAVFQPLTLILIAAGTLLGIIIGGLPGLSAMMGVAVLIPITYGMEKTAGILTLVGVYCGAVYGGSISAILVNIPGTPSAVMTTLDGYPLAKRGEAGRALGMSTFSSGVGGLLSTFVLVVLAPVVARFALNFTSYEMFAIAAFGISILAYISTGSTIKGLISGMLGLLIATIGADPILAVPRYTFGQMELFSGVNFVPAMIGFYGVGRDSTER